MFEVDLMLFYSWADLERTKRLHTYIISILHQSLFHFFISKIKYHILTMFKIKCDFNQQDLKTVDLHLSNLNNFHSLEVVDRVSETQLQVVKITVYN